MFSRKHSPVERVFFMWIGLVAISTTTVHTQSTQGSGTTAVPGTRWETPARMHGAFLNKESGTLTIGESAVEFKPEHGDTKKWAFVDIDTLSIAPHKLVLTTFSNRSLHRPGEKSYHFELHQTLPPSVAASLATDVARPSRNTISNSEEQEIASIPARHKKPTGGTNGVLRFHEKGIEYITSSSGDSRSWRWADLQALSEPEPYHLLIFGYRDTYTFQLKKPLSRSLLDRATDEIYRSSGAEPTVMGGDHAQVP
jgi:hypothetical protein